MTDRTLEIGCFQYDTTQPLFDGTIPADSLERTMETAATLPEIFERLIRGERVRHCRTGPDVLPEAAGVGSAVRRAADLPEPGVPALVRLRQHPFRDHGTT